MNRCLISSACLCVLAVCDAAASQPWGALVLRDDFDGPALSSDWVVNHPGHYWWVQGRTHFPDPGTTAGPFPRPVGGACVFEHHHYNPYHLVPPKTTLLGGEIRTAAEFEPSRGYRFEARVRSVAHPSGLVSSFFLYGYDGSASDEVDFEFVSKQTHDDVTYPLGDPVLTNTWDESLQNPRYVAPGGLDLSDWNTFRIYWTPHLQRVDWTWLGPAGETPLRTQTVSRVPDEPMALYFNFWAPTASWGDAYDAGLEPAQVPAEDQVFTYEIDHVEICARRPGDANVDGAVDVFDLAALANHYELPGPMAWPDGDFTLDATVDVFDLAVLANHYGLPAGGSPVPEPGAAGLLIAGWMAALGARRTGAGRASKP